MYILYYIWCTDTNQRTFTNQTDGHITNVLKLINEEQVDKTLSSGFVESPLSSYMCDHVSALIVVDNCYVEHVAKSNRVNWLAQFHNDITGVNYIFPIKYF